MKNTFKDFDLQPYLLEAIEALGFTEPTDIQQEVITHIGEGLDIIGQ